MKRPTDDEIIAALRTSGSLTALVRDDLIRQGFDVETPWVLRQLKRLENAGKVRRVPTVYRVQIRWASA